MRGGECTGMFFLSLSLYFCHDRQNSCQMHACHLAGLIMFCHCVDLCFVYTQGSQAALLRITYL